MIDDPLERLRAICLARPEATERLSHGEPTFFVRDKKLFVTYADHHHNDRLSFWCHAPVAPSRRWWSPIGGASSSRRTWAGRGWIGVYLDVERDDAFWDEITEVVEDAYRMVAPRALVARLDAERSDAERRLSNRARRWPVPASPGHRWALRSRTVAERTLPGITRMP